MFFCRTMGPNKPGETSIVARVFGLLIEPHMQCIWKVCRHTKQALLALTFTADPRILGSIDASHTQSNFVNARTSQDWVEHSAGHVVRGRLRWVSTPLKFGTPEGGPAEARVYPDRPTPSNASSPLTKKFVGQKEADAENATSTVVLGAFVLVGFGLLAVGLVMRARTRGGSGRLISPPVRRSGGDRV